MNLRRRFVWRIQREPCITLRRDAARDASRVSGFSTLAWAAGGMEAQSAERPIHLRAAFIRGDE